MISINSIKSGLGALLFPLLFCTYAVSAETTEFPRSEINATEAAAKAQESRRRIAERRERIERSHSANTPPQHLPNELGTRESLQKLNKNGANKNIPSIPQPH